jgi:hypothetical protein
VWTLVVLVFFSASPNKAAGYVLPAVAPLAIATGIALARAETVRALRTTGAFHAILALAVFVPWFVPRVHERLAAAPTAAVVVTGLAALVFFGSVAGFALAGRHRRAALVAAGGASAFLLCAVAFLIVPATTPFDSLREPGTAIRERLREGDRVVVLLGDVPGLLWYADAPLEDPERTRHVFDDFGGAARLFVYGRADALGKFERRTGRKPHLLWRRPGGEHVVFTNFPVD